MVIEDEPADAKKREKTDEERMADYASLVQDKIESLPGELALTADGRWGGAPVNDPDRRWDKRWIVDGGRKPRSRVSVL